MKSSLSFPFGLALFLTIAIFLISTPVYAETDDENDDESSVEVTETGDPDYYNIEGIVGEAGEDVPIGIVDDIEITGSIRVPPTIIIRQLTFKIGDEISQADLDLSRKRIFQLNGLFWHAEFEVLESDEPGHINLILTVKMRRTWFAYPAQSGASLGDRNFFNTGKGAAAGFYSIDDSTYAYLYYTDPQIFGGHNSLTYEGHLIEGDIITRTDLDFSAGEEYLYEKRGGYLRYGTKWNEKIFVSAMLKIEDVSTEVKWDPYPDQFADDTFYLSDSWIPPGQLVIINFSLGKGKYNSAFFPTEGYTLYLSTDQSLKLLGSDFNFSRYSVRATRYFGLEGHPGHSFAVKGEYGLASGDLPHYELPVVDFQIRGMGGASDRGLSYLTMSGEYRFYLWPSILQGVFFVDSGRAWDDVDLGFSDFQTTYGVGVRYQTFEHWGFNVLLRADYSLGPYDQRWYFGLGHAF